jgi:hypothetical protein
LSFCFIKFYAMKIHGGVEFTPRERAPKAHRIGGWVGLGASLDTVEKRKILPFLAVQP